MSKGFNAILIVTFSLFEIILTFFLGLFGDKLAEITEIDRPTLFLRIAITIVLLLLVMVLLIGVRNDTPNPMSSLRIATNTFITVIPMAATIGGGIQFVSLLLINEGNIALNLPFFMVRDYEILSAFFALGTILVFKALRRDVVLMVAYSIGLAAGISGTLLVLRPDENVAVITFIGWSLFVILVALLLSERARQYVSSTLERLVRVRD